MIFHSVKFPEDHLNPYDMQCTIGFTYCTYSTTHEHGRRQKYFNKKKYVIEKRKPSVFICCIQKKEREWVKWVIENFKLRKDGGGRT